MDFFQNPYYRLNMRLLFYLGMWPLENPSERKFFRIMPVALLGTVIVPELIKLIECMGNLTAIIECLPVLGVHIRAVVKYFNSRIQTIQMRKLTNRIKDDWTVRTGEVDKAILISYAERGRLLTVIYAVYMFSALGFFLSLPLIPLLLDVIVPLNQSRDRVYFFQAEYFVDQDEKFFYVLIHAYITTPITLAIFVACDTMYAVHVHHACSIFTTLRARLQSVRCITNNNKQEKHKDEAYDDIVVCVKMHNEAIAIANLIESSSCMSLLFVAGASVLTTVMTGFMTVTNLHDPGESLRFGMVLVGELIHLFYLCWQGHVLMEHGHGVFVNAYNIDWCDISLRAKKLLLLIMLRSLEPCKLTAGKIFDLSMESYAATVTNLDHPSESLRFGMVLVGELIHLFYLCWQGHVLMMHSQDVFINAYNIDWCDIPLRAKKLLLLIMLRSLVPCKLTAGKLFVLSMERYAAALKTMLSYFTVLLSLQ